MMNIAENYDNSHIIELCCNVDDMSGEDIAYAAEKIKAGGATDVSWLPVGMKKGRPGTRLIVVCRPGDREKILHLIFKHTSTIGIRETVCRKHLLRSSTGFVETPYGTVKVKCSEGYGVQKEKIEYEDLKRLADENDLSLDKIRNSVKENTARKDTAS